METRILDILKSLEKEKNIEILLAVESGSRAWGFASPDSDYDIRFLYKHSKEYYLSPWSKKDTIEFMTEDELDSSGWDLRKAFQLLEKSNASLLEYLYSSIMYIKNDLFLNEIKALAIDAFSPIATVFHYLSMAKKYWAYCDVESFKLKSLFYCLRSTLACKWILERGTFPPVSFLEMLDLLPQEILEKTQRLLILKTTNNETFVEDKDIVLIDYLKLELSSISEKAKTLKDGKIDRDKGDKIFLDILNF